MSLNGPNTFIVVGDADHWDFSCPGAERNPELIIDSRMRTLGRRPVAVAGGIARGRVSRAPTKAGLYAEYVCLANTGHRFGLIDSTYVPTATSFMTQAFAGNVALLMHSTLTDIRLNGVVVQSGLGSSGTTDRIGIHFYLNGSTPTVQFYRNRVTIGTPVAIGWSLAKLAASLTSTSASAYLCVDFDDLPWLPPGAQPWGSACRVADAGGYSLPASRFNSALKNASITLDDFEMSAASASVMNNSVYATRSRVKKNNPSLLAIYLEFQFESGVTGFVGMAPAGLSLSAYPGSTATSIGVSTSLGRVYVNGAFTTPTAAYVATDTVGFIWRPGIGIWVTKNGVAVSGNPTAGTGAHLATAAGVVLFPVGGPNNNAIFRICAHARTQRNRPIYCEAWDGADILPEQHFRGTITSNTKFEEGVWFPNPWGGTGGSGSSIGAIELSNFDRYYNFLSAHNVRDQDICAYDYVDGVPAYIARGNCETIRSVKPGVTRILSRGKDTKLDSSNVLDYWSIGMPLHVPVFADDLSIPRYVFEASKNISLGAFLWKVYDKGLLVNASSAAYNPVGLPHGFTRSAAVAGKQTVSYVDGVLGSDNARLSAGYIMGNAGFSTAEYDLTGVLSTVSFDLWTNEKATHRKYIDLLLGAQHTALYTRADGLIGFSHLPNVTLATSTFTIGAELIVGEVTYETDMAPNLSTSYTARHITAPYTADELAGAVTAAVGKEISRDYLIYNLSASVNLHSYYEHAKTAKPTLRYTQYLSPSTTPTFDCLLNYERMCVFVDIPFKIETARLFDVGDVGTFSVPDVSEISKAFVVRKTRYIYSPEVVVTIFGPTN